MIVEESERDLGDFMVGRYLPFRKKKCVGPFVFVDHMKRAEIGPNQYIDVNQHPHIGLSTLTYLLEGEVEHRDSTGVVKSITPGNVGFMTAGSGVTHTERTPENMRNGQVHTVHGYQIWIALPIEKEKISPRFDYYPNETLPKWNENNVEMTLVAGNAFGKSSPLTGHSDLFMLDAYAEKDTSIAFQGNVKGEVGFLITQGSIIHAGEELHTGQMLISKTNEECTIDLKADTRLIILGGEPLPEERYLEWNFVASSKEILAQAKTRWQNKEFPEVPGDDSYIPLP